MIKKIVLGAVVSAILGIGIATATQDSTPTGAVDSPLVQEVQDHENRLNNHEGRITNTEKDVKVLQQNTGSAPASDKVSVPTVSANVSTPPAVPTAPAPITVVSYRQISLQSSEDVDCEYTYSDGTTYQWHWKTIENNQDLKITHTDGICDNRALEITKN